MCSPERRNTMASFTNQATLTYNGGTVNSNIVTGELVQVLTASKTAAAESYRTGDLVTYVVQLRSTGAAALTGLTVTDTLGTTNFPATGGTVQLTPLTYQAGTLRYFMNGVLQTAPAVTVLANGIRIEGVTVPAGGVSTLVYTTRVNAFADPSAEGTIENTVTVTGGGLTGFMATRYLGSISSGSSGNSGSSGGTVTTKTAYVNNPRSTQILHLRETPSQSARSIGQYYNGTQVKVVSYGATWCEVYVGTRHGYMMTRYLSFNGTYVTPTPRYVYVTPTPTPQVIYITPTPTPLVEYITPTPTPLVEYITPKPAEPAAPTSGSIITLAVAYGSSSNTINVYYDQAMTSLKATYTGGKQATMLSYGDNVCMILVDGGVAYVSTWNVNY